MIVPFFTTYMSRRFRPRPVSRVVDVLMLASMLALAGCAPQPDPEIRLSGSTMGTTYTLKLVNWDGDAKKLQEDIDQRLVGLNNVLSTYQQDSELSAMNRYEVGSSIPVSDELRSVLLLSKSVHRVSSGAFDVTVGPLVNLWGFGPGGPRQGVPASDEIAQALSRVGFDRVEINSEAVARPAGIYIDLSAIAKGYAVDEIARLVESAGAARFMVEIGGEIRARGTNRSGKDWVIGLEAPDRSQRALLRTLPLRNTGMATSGDYRNFFEHEGVTYSHTIDPRTGWPVQHGLASVTVLHRDTAMADGLATAFSVLGPEQTFSLAEEMNLPVLAIIRQADGYREVYSTAMKQYLGI